MIDLLIHRLCRVQLSTRLIEDIIMHECRKLHGINQHRFQPQKPHFYYLNPLKPNSIHGDNKLIFSPKSHPSHHRLTNVSTLIPTDPTHTIPSPHRHRRAAPADASRAPAASPASSLRPVRILRHEAISPRGAARHEFPCFIHVPFPVTVSTSPSATMHLVPISHSLRLAHAHTFIQHVYIQLVLAVHLHVVRRAHHQCHHACCRPPTSASAVTRPSLPAEPRRAAASSGLRGPRPCVAARVPFARAVSRAARRRGVFDGVRRPMS